eukprot:s805_g26.t1
MHVSFSGALYSVIFLELIATLEAAQSQTLEMLIVYGCLSCLLCSLDFAMQTPGVKAASDFGLKRRHQPDLNARAPQQDHAILFW